MRHDLENEAVESLAFRGNRVVHSPLERTCAGIFKPKTQQAITPTTVLHASSAALCGKSPKEA